MALSDFQSAMTTLRTLVSADNWDGVRKQLMVCRSHLAEIPEGGSDGTSVSFQAEQLDKIEADVKELIARSRRRTTDRFVHTRQNYATR